MVIVGFNPKFCKKKKIHTTLLKSKASIPCDADMGLIGGGARD